MYRKPKIVFDYDYLSSLDAPDSIGELFFLTEPAQQVLSQLAEMVLWTGTRWENGTESEIETLAHRIYEELKVPLHLDDFIPLVDDVETLLRGLKLQAQCCDSPITYAPVEPIQDGGFDPNDGPTPTVWGNNEPIADADDYRAVWCGQAAHWVDWLTNLGSEMDAALNTGVLNVDAIAGILSFAGSIGLLISIPFGVVANVAAGIISAGTGILWTVPSAAIAAAKDDIICTILLNDEQALRDKIESIVGPVAWALFYSHLYYGDLLRGIQTGVYRGETIPIRRATCPDCGLPEVNPEAGPFIAVDIPDANLTLSPYVVGGSTNSITKTVEAGIVKGIRFEGIGRNNNPSTFGATIRFNPTWCSNLKGWSWRVRVLTVTGQQTNLVYNMQGSAWYPGAPTNIILDSQYARNTWTIGTPAEHNQMLNSYVAALNSTGQMTDAQNWLFEKVGATDPSSQWVIEFDNFYALAGPGATTCTERVI